MHNKLFISAVIFFIGFGGIFILPHIYKGPTKLGQALIVLSGIIGFIGLTLMCYR